MAPMKAPKDVSGVYRLAWGQVDSIRVELNAVGCVVSCDDMEQISSSPDPRHPHCGAKARFFNPRFGRFFAGELFFATALLLHKDVS
jgi:hypothetical protein